MFRGRKDKLEGTISEEFLADAQLIKQTREYTQEVVKYIQKMVQTAAPVGSANANPMQQKALAVQMDELQELSQTCENSMHYFYQQRYYYVLKTTSEVCTQLSKKQKYTIQEVHDRVMMPFKVWIDEDYPRFVRDLQKCYKLKKTSDAASAAWASKSTPARESRATAAKEQYDQQLRMCRGEVEKTRKIRKHHTNCLKLMATMHHKYSKSVVEEIEKAQALLARQINEIGEKDKKED